MVGVVIKKNQKAFTLIELLVVVAIIGILAAVGVVAYNGYTSAAKVKTTFYNHQQAVKNMKTLLFACETVGTVNLKTGPDGSTSDFQCSSGASGFSLICYERNNRMWIETNLGPTQGCSGCATTTERIYIDIPN